MTFQRLNRRAVTRTPRRAAWCTLSCATGSHQGDLQAVAAFARGSLLRRQRARHRDAHQFRGILPRVRKQRHLALQAVANQFRFLAGDKAYEVQLAILEFMDLETVPAFLKEQRYRRLSGCVGEAVHAIQLAVGSEAFFRILEQSYPMCGTE